MKTYSLFKNVSGLLGLTLAFLIIFITPGYSQDKGKPQHKKTITLKIVTDDNGKTKVMDTTFTSDAKIDMKQMNEYLKGMSDFEFQAGDLELPDSTFLDSVRQLCGRAIMINKNFKGPRFKFRDFPGGFDYDFEIENPEGRMRDAEEFENFDRSEMMPGPEMRRFRFEKPRQTLSDVIGDIPMDRVKSYSIKDRKGGKRIVIDVEENPFMEKERHVIIMRHPGRHGVHPQRHNADRKIMIRTESREKSDNPENPSDTETGTPQSITH